MFKNGIKTCVANALNRVVSVFDKLKSDKNWPANVNIKDVFSLSGRLIFCVAGVMNMNYNFGKNSAKDSNKTEPIADADIIILNYLANIIRKKAEDPSADIEALCNYASERLIKITNMATHKNILHGLSAMADDLDDSSNNISSSLKKSAGIIMQDKSAASAMKYIRYLAIKASDDSNIAESVIMATAMRILDAIFKQIDEAYSDVNLLLASAADLKALNNATDALALKIAMDAVDKVVSREGGTMHMIVAKHVPGMILGQGKILSQVFHENCGKLCADVIKRKMLAILNADLAFICADDIQGVVDNIRLNYDPEYAAVSDMSDDDINAAFSKMFLSRDGNGLGGAVMGSTENVMSGLFASGQELLSTLTTDEVYDEVILKKGGLDILDHEAVYAAYANRVAYLNDKDGESVPEKFEPKKGSESLNPNSKLFN